MLQLSSALEDFQVIDPRCNRAYFFKEVLHDPPGPMGQPVMGDGCLQSNDQPCDKGGTQCQRDDWVGKTLNRPRLHELLDGKQAEREPRCHSHGPAVPFPGCNPSDGVVFRT